MSKYATVVDVEHIIKGHTDEGIQAPWTSMVEDIPHPLLYIEGRVGAGGG
jgi:hypothetical protein